MKKIFTISTVLFFFFNCRAQTFDSTTFYSNSNFVYGNLNKAKITTGLLREYGIDFVNLDNYDGQTLHDSNWVNLTDWRVLYASLYSDQIATSSMVYLDTINNRLNRYSADSLPINFTGLDFYYQGLDTNAINRGLIKIVSGQLYDDSSGSQSRIIFSPYITYRTFAFATSQQFAHTGNNQFIFRSNLFFTNTGKTISQIQVDPTGTGTYQTVAFNVPFTINYADTGLKPMTIKVTYSDNSINYSHTKLAVYFTQLSSEKYGIRPTTNISITATKAYSGIYGHGDITIDLAKNNSTGQIRKPLLVVEGFDPDGSFRFNPDYLNQINFDPNNSNSQISLNQGLDDNNDYDLIFLHYSNGTDYIQRNAYMLEAAIKYVNDNKTTYNGVRQQNVIIGMSMGGLVARYALRDMELSSLSHETRLFISHDAPHWGANVPAAYQALVQHIAPWKIINIGGNFPAIFYRDLFPDAVDAVHLFSTPAAKQMLIQRYNLTGSTLIADNSTHISFMNELDGMGWPQQCKNATLTNGACNGSTQGFSSGSELLSIYGSESMGTYFGDIWRSLLFTIGGTPITLVGTGGTIPLHSNALLIQFPLSLITTKSTFYFDFAAWAASTNTSSLIYKGDMYIKRQLFFGVFNTTSYILKLHVPVPSGMLSLDNAPGGVYDLSQFNFDPSDINSQLHHYIGNWVNLTVLQKRFCFVPTVSSLALSNPTGNLFSNVCSSIPCLEPGSVTNHFAPTANQIHISYTQPSANWILNIQDPTYNCPDICAANLSISGPDLICSTGTYSVSGLGLGMTVTWSVQPSGIAGSVASGNSLTLTRIQDGTVTVFATISNSCGDQVQISKSVGVGKPVLIGSNYTVNGYTSGITSLNNDDYDYICYGPVVHVNVTFQNASNLVWQTSAYPTSIHWSDVSSTEKTFYFFDIGQTAFFSITASNTCGSSVASGNFASKECDPGDPGSCDGYAISPNPANSGTLRIGPQPNIPAPCAGRTIKKDGTQRISKFTISEVRIYDNTGTLRKYARAHDSKQLSIDIHGLLPGSYRVQISDGIYKENHTLIVQ